MGHLPATTTGQGGYTISANLVERATALSSVNKI